ncbi:hypothetical protein HMN09_01069500 [Mycena chlorophos]|uniref:Uncharacterized protein n=1 Tax=Mycena chlorophos TaxID=658473 RepID=A0A8H6SBR0_MYCCL|nr:hypothetical protein HMN09_01069500 [Mycena chlorophos]
MPNSNFVPVTNHVILSQSLPPPTMSTPDDRRFAAELEAQRCRVHAAATTAAMERMRLDGWEPASRRPADDGVFAAELEAQRCRVRATAAEAEMEQMRLDNLERELLRRSGTAHSRPHSGPPHHRRAHTPPPPSPTPPSAQPPRSQGPPRPPHAVPRPPPRVEKEGRNIVFVVFRGTKVGLVNSMTEVNLRTEGFRGAVWQGYPDRESAGTAFTLASRARLTSTTSLPIGQLAVDVEAAPRPIRSRDLGNVQRLEARAWNDLCLHLGKLKMNMCACRLAPLSLLFELVDAGKVARGVLG